MTANIEHLSRRVTAPGTVLSHHEPHTTIGDLAHLNTPLADADCERVRSDRCVWRYRVVQLCDEAVWPVSAESGEAVP